MNSLGKTLLKMIPPILIAGVGFIAFNIISYQKPAIPSKEAKSRPPIFVRTQIARYEENRLSKKLWARVKPLKSISLRSETSGRIIDMAIHLTPGLEVQKDQILAVIDSERLEALELATLARKQSLEVSCQRLLQEKENIGKELELSRKQFNIARHDTLRFRQLLKDNATSETQLASFEQSETARAIDVRRLENRLLLIPVELAKLESDQKQISAELITIRRDLKDTVIKAPFHGILQSPVKQKGDWLRAGDTLCLLESHLETELWTTLALSDLKCFQDGPYQAQLINQEHAKITFSRKLGRVDEKLQTATLIFRTNTADLSLNAVIPLEVSKKLSPKTIKLPRTALRENNTVYVVQNGKLSKLKVSVENIFNGHVFISDGLEENDVIIISHIENAIEGQQVKTQVP